MNGANPERREVPNGAKSRTTRNPERREIPDDENGARSFALGVYGILCVRSYSSQQELR